MKVFFERIVRVRETYFDSPVSPGFVSLYTGKLIIEIAGGLIGIFLPVFLYELFDRDFRLVMLYYGAASLLYLLVLSLGTQFLNTFGFRRALRTSVFVGAAFFASFIFMHPENIWYLIPLSLVLLTLFRVFYWVPYHTGFASFTDPYNRGRQVSIVYAAQLLINVATPIIAGFLITRFGFEVLFVIALTLYLVSGIPYATLPKTYETYSWTLRRYFREVFSRRRRALMLSHVAYGADNLVGLVVWPIFIFELLDGNFFGVGLISTTITGASVVLQLFVGKYVDGSVPKERILGWGSAFYAFGWVVKIFIATAFQIFIAGVYHNITKIFTRTPFETLSYEIAADGGHYVDEYTVLKETALNVGKVLMASLAALVSFFFPLQWVFAIAAGAALAFNLIRVYQRRF